MKSIGNINNIVWFPLPLGTTRALEPMEVVLIILMILILSKHLIFSGFDLRSFSVRGPFRSVAQIIK